MVLLTSPIMHLVAAATIMPMAMAMTKTCIGETPHIREYFYVGGEYTGDGAGGHIFHNQMYVEKLSPTQGSTHPFPIVLMHGQAQTGTNFLNKPDGSCGWASLFLQQGYELYIIDQTFRGRSAWQPAAGASKPSTYSAEFIQQRFTSVQNYMLWPQAVNHTQWPGTGLMGDPYFDTFYSSNMQFINNETYQQSTVQAAGAALLDRIGKPVILAGHSQGGLLPLLIADVRPELTKALILLEPKGPPFREAVFSNATSRAWGLTDIHITYSPLVTSPSSDLVQQVIPAPSSDLVDCVLQAEEPAPRQLVNLASKPILLVTAQASYHAIYDYCTARFLQQAGCKQTTHLQLADAGVYGNGHMMFMEKNSDEVQGLLQRWIRNLA
ncbi:hypothetical protein V500_06618 [Pseudogymnoascus sp. VKM F-4518 (FW-2643)]|nr:hypothetical protein V500_06618 [Pseudogymnoascus sp. VKM F-4518 (FW-2643)]